MLYHLNCPTCPPFHALYIWKASKRTISSCGHQLFSSIHHGSNIENTNERLSLAPEMTSNDRRFLVGAALRHSLPHPIHPVQYQIQFHLGSASPVLRPVLSLYHQDHQSSSTSTVWSIAPPKKTSTSRFSQDWTNTSNKRPLETPSRGVWNVPSSGEGINNLDKRST